MISTFSSGGKLIDVWTGEQFPWSYGERFVLTSIPAWKQYFANDMYFMPMFDETDGYYTAASGVSLPTIISS